MSATVRLSAKLAKDDELNGLDDLAADLIEDPAKIRCAVIWFDAVKVTHDTDTGDDIPTARIRKLEPIGDAKDVPDIIRKAVADAYHARSGSQPLPFEDVDPAGKDDE